MASRLPENGWVTLLRNRWVSLRRNGWVSMLRNSQPNTTLQEKMAYYKIKGLSIAVINNYQIEWAKGYGWADSAEQRPVTTETLFEPGSISKSINALGVLKLVQDKKIDLNTDINNYLTSWKFPYDSLSKNKKITVANLLSHTAGLTVHGFLGYYNGDSLPTVVQTLDGKKPATNSPVRSQFEPGLKYQYSGGGIMVSQLIAMDVTHQPYDKYISENVFQPIGMTNSSFTQPPPINKKQLLATGYTADGKEIKGKYPIVEQAAGGLWTTPTDLCKFIIEIQLSLQGKSNKVLSQEMTKKMLTPYIDGSSALGVFVETKGKTKYFQHGAGNQGFRGKYYGSFEDGKGVVIIVNSDNGGIIDEIIASVANVYQWKGFNPSEKPVIKKTVSVPDSILNKCTGVYKQKNEVVTITKKDNALWYQASGAPWKIYFTSNTEFFSLESKSEKQFYMDDKGKIKGFTKQMDGKDLGKVEKLNLINLPDSISQKYIGTYEYSGITSEVTKRDGSLWITTNTPVKMNFISTTDYYTVDDFGVEYKFVFINGTVSGILAKEGKEENLAKKINLLSRFFFVPGIIADHFKDFHHTVSLLAFVLDFDLDFSILVNASDIVFYFVFLYQFRKLRYCFNWYIQLHGSHNLFPP